MSFYSCPYVPGGLEVSLWIPQQQSVGSPPVIGLASNKNSKPHSGSKLSWLRQVIIKKNEQL